MLACIERNGIAWFLGAWEDQQVVDFMNRHPFKGFDKFVSYGNLSRPATCIHVHHTLGDGRRVRVEYLPKEKFHDREVHVIVEPPPGVSCPL